MEKYSLPEAGISNETVSCDNLCEVYNETTNEQQFLKGLSIDPISFLGLVAVNDEVFLLSCEPAWLHEYPVEMSETLRVECHYPGSDQWKLKTKITITLEKDSCLNFAIRGTVKVSEDFVVLRRLHCATKGTIPVQHKIYRLKQATNESVLVCDF